MSRSFGELYSQASFSGKGRDADYALGEAKAGYIDELRALNTARADGADPGIVAYLREFITIDDC